MCFRSHAVPRQVYDRDWKYTILKLIVHDHYSASLRSSDWSLTICEILRSLDFLNIRSFRSKYDHYTLKDRYLKIVYFMFQWWYGFRILEISGSKSLVYFTLSFIDFSWSNPHRLKDGCTHQRFFGWNILELKKSHFLCKIMLKICDRNVFRTENVTFGNRMLDTNRLFEIIWHGSYSSRHFYSSCCGNCQRSKYLWINFMRVKRLNFNG